MPATGGILPYWLLITSVASAYNVVQNYFTLKQSKEVYGGKPELSAFGIQSIADPSEPACWASLLRVDRHGGRGALPRRVRHQQQGVSWSAGRADFF